MTDIFEEEYSTRLNTPSDIYEHLPTLKQYASECESVLELGVRNCVSSWALALGLLKNSSKKKVMYMNDINVCNTSHIESVSASTDLKIVTKWGNNLEFDLDEDVDLTFIDTWHVYGQLKRELARFAPHTRKYIIMHDTTVDEWEGETKRNIHKYDVKKQSAESGIPVEEILKCLWPAIEEFLIDNPEWSLHARWSNNNGLTVLARKV
jgi:hypothetical protein